QPLSTPPSPPRFISACLTLLCPTARPPPDTYTLSLHDALPIFLDAAPAVDLGQVLGDGREQGDDVGRVHRPVCGARDVVADEDRSEEHTSELQSRENLVCRLLLEKKKKAKCGCTAG